MTLLPFEDQLPPSHEAVGFPEFYLAYPRKVGRYKASIAYGKARKLASHDEIMAGLERYKANKPDYCDWMHPTTFLNGRRWEDEYERPTATPGAFQGQSLETIAEIAKKPWARCRYPRDVLEQCVAADLLTKEEMEAAL